MLNEQLKKTVTMEGRSVDMKVIATGEIHDAYDIYLDVCASGGCVRADTGEEDRMNITMFVRLIYWKTTHKKIVIGTVEVLDGGGFNSAIVEEFERISTPVEIKDYWKKSFEKYVVVKIGELLHTNRGLNELNCLFFIKTPDEIRPKGDFKSVVVFTCPIASWEITRRQGIIQSGEEPGSLHKCYDGPHGFVRSDKADNFDIPPVSSFPVTTLVV